MCSKNVAYLVRWGNTGIWLDWFVEVRCHAEERVTLGHIVTNIRIEFDSIVCTFVDRRRRTWKAWWGIGCDGYVRVLDSLNLQLIPPVNGSTVDTVENSFLESHGLFPVIDLLIVKDLGTKEKSGCNWVYEIASKSERLDINDKPCCRGYTTVGS